MSLRIRIAHALIWVADRFEKPKPKEPCYCRLTFYTTKDTCDPSKPNDW